MADIKTDDNVMSTSTPKRDRCFLLELPQELFEIICDYAYQFPGQNAIIWRKRWERRELERRVANPDHAITPFPSTKINDFLVSKKFFIAAARSYTSRGRFELESLRLSHTIQHTAGIFCQWVTALKLEFSNLYVFKPFVSLRDVQLSLLANYFYDMDPGAIYLRDCHDLELKESSAYLTITTDLAGLQRVELIPRLDRSTRGHQEQFTANLKRLEHLVKPLVLAPASLKTGTVAPSTTSHLYFGSAVQLDRAELVLPESPQTALRSMMMRGAIVSANAMSLIKRPPKHQNWQQDVNGNETGLSGIDPGDFKSFGAQAATHQSRPLRAARSLEDIDIPDSLEDVMNMLEEDKDRVSRYLLKSKRKKERDTPKLPEDLSTARIDWESFKLMDPISLRLIPIGIPREAIQTTASVQRNSNTAKIAVSQYRDQRRDPADGTVVKAHSNRSRYQKAEAVKEPSNIEPQHRIPDLSIQPGHSGHLPRSLTVADLLAEEQEGWSELHDIRHAFDKQDEVNDAVDHTPVTTGVDDPSEQYFELPADPPTRRPRFESSLVTSERLTEPFPNPENIRAWLPTRSPPRRYADSLRAQAKANISPPRHVTFAADVGLPPSATKPDLLVGEMQKGGKWRKPLTSLFKLRSKRSDK